MKFFFLSAILLAFPAFLQAQNNIEVGLSAGGSYYLGDLNPGIHFKGTQIAYGLLARYNIDERWAVKLSAYRGEVKGSSSNTTYLPERNLTFQQPDHRYFRSGGVQFLPLFDRQQEKFAHAVHLCRGRCLLL